MKKIKDKKIKALLNIKNVIKSKALTSSLHKITKFHLISWSESFVETDSFCRVLGKFPERNLLRDLLKNLFLVKSIFREELGNSSLMLIKRT